MKPLLGVLLFLAGGFLGGMTQTNFFKDAETWQWILALVFAFMLCGIGIELIRNKKYPDDDENADE